MNILVTRPEHDDTTYYLSHWSKKILDFAKKKGEKIFDLNRERATKKEVTSFLSKKNPEFVIFNGHGDDDLVSGHKNETLIKAGENEGLLKNKMIYAISCKSAKKLGPESISAGAISYIGYDDDFVFIYEKNKITNPLIDDIAKIYLEPSNELIISLIKGNSTSESYKRSQDMFMTNLKKLLTSEAPSTPAVRYLWWDIKHQVLLGDKEAALS